VQNFKTRQSKKDFGSEIQKQSEISQGIRAQTRIYRSTNSIKISRVKAGFFKV
jgi:hypothetical protein